jgi:hypothetical protein
MISITLTFVTSMAFASMTRVKKPGLTLEKLNSSESTKKPTLMDFMVFLHMVGFEVLV